MRLLLVAEPTLNEGAIWLYVLVELAMTWKLSYKLVDKLDLLNAQSAWLLYHLSEVFVQRGTLEKENYESYDLSDLIHDLDRIMTIIAL